MYYVKVYKEHHQGLPTKVTLTSLNERNCMYHETMETTHNSERAMQEVCQIIKVVRDQVANK